MAVSKRNPRKTTKATKRHACKHCSETFSSMRLRISHVATVHGTSPPPQCNACGKILSSNASLQRHEEVMHNKTCKYCKQQFDMLCTHICEQWVTRTLCKSCGQTFTTEASLRRHEASFRNKTCRDCNEQIDMLCGHDCDAKLPEAIAELPRADRPQCTACHQTFESKKGLRLHKTWSVDRACFWCSKTFPMLCLHVRCPKHKKKLRRKASTLERYPCPHCRKPFTTAASRRHHIKRMTDSRCPKCQKVCTYRCLHHCKQQGSVRLSRGPQQRSQNEQLLQEGTDSAPRKKQFTWQWEDKETRSLRVKHGYDEEFENDLEERNRAFEEHHSLLEVNTHIPRICQGFDDTGCPYTEELDRRNARLELIKPKSGIHYVALSTICVICNYVRQHMKDLQAREERDRLDLCLGGLTCMEVRAPNSKYCEAHKLRASESGKDWRRTQGDERAQSIVFASTEIKKHERRLTEFLELDSTARSRVNPQAEQIRHKTLSTLSRKALPAAWDNLRQDYQAVHPRTYYLDIEGTWTRLVHLALVNVHKEVVLNVVVDYGLDLSELLAEDSQAPNPCHKYLLAKYYSDVAHRTRPAERQYLKPWQVARRIEDLNLQDALVLDWSSGNYDWRVVHQFLASFGEEAIWPAKPSLSPFSLIKFNLLADRLATYKLEEFFKILFYFSSLAGIHHWAETDAFKLAAVMEVVLETTRVPHPTKTTSRVLAPTQTKIPGEDSEGRK